MLKVASISFFGPIKLHVSGGGCIWLWDNNILFISRSSSEPQIHSGKNSNRRLQFSSLEVCPERRQRYAVIVEDPLAIYGDCGTESQHLPSRRHFMTSSTPLQTCSVVHESIAVIPISQLCRLTNWNNKMQNENMLLCLQSTHPLIVFNLNTIPSILITTEMYSMITSGTQGWSISFKSMTAELISDRWSGYILAGFSAAKLFCFKVMVTDSP